MPLTRTGIAYDTQPRQGLQVPLVLLHAGVADRRMWDPQWDTVALEHGAMRMDLRGFGESDTPPPGPFSHVADVLGAMTEAGIERAHLVAASFGAGVAVEVALTAPERVASLFLAPPGGSLLQEITEDLRTFVNAEDAALSAGRLDAAARLNVDTWLVGPGRRRSDVPIGLLGSLEAMQRRAFDATDALGEVEEVELDPPPVERLGEIAVPTTVLVGAHDLDTTHAAVHHVHALVPGARRVDWDDVAHLPSLEQPERFDAALREHLG